MYTCCSHFSGFVCCNVFLGWRGSSHCELYNSWSSLSIGKWLLSSTRIGKMWISPPKFCDPLFWQVCNKPTSGLGKDMLYLLIFGSSWKVSSYGFHLESPLLVKEGPPSWLWLSHDVDRKLIKFSNAIHTDDFGVSLRRDLRSPAEVSRLRSKLRSQRSLVPWSVHCPMIIRYHKGSIHLHPFSFISYMINGR